jgi:PAS domain S-box-containing protein
MPRDTRTRRLTGRSVGGVSTAFGADGAAVPLVSLLARATRLTDLLPPLHERALEATGGSCSLLFETNPRTGVMQATSAFGLDALRTDPWMPGPGESDLVSDAFSRSAATLIVDADRQMPNLAERIGTTTALLLPLARGRERVGLLVVGYNGPPDRSARADSAQIADAFLTAIELSRLRQSDELQQDLRELLDEFSDSLAATMNLAGGLDTFCHGASRLFGADRTSVWIHDRRARQLALKASSDPEHMARGVRVDAEDLLSPIALTMRRARAEIVRPSADAATFTVTVPLRGTRRALGTIVFDGVRVEAGGELDLLDRADEIGRQLSSAIENLQLLDDVARSRQELENTFDSIAHLIVVADRRGHIVHVNQAFANRAARPREQMLDRPLAEFIGPQLAAWLHEHDQATVRPGGDAPATCEIVDPTLKGPFMVTASDLLNHDRERVGSVIVARDLTPQTKLEAEREELRHRLTQSEKLAALGQFVAGIAHELNNPLQGVLGHLELLRVTGAIPKNLRDEIRTVYREADRAAKIVRNLLVFAGSRRIARRPVSLNSVLQRVLALRADACRAAGIELVRNYDNQLPRVQSDPLLLHQVFLNMIMNAEHALHTTGDGGRIEITTSSAGDRIISTVRDTGPGIMPDVLSRIFEPFYTTKDVGKGTGLGLAIAYGIVQEHGGHIAAANHPDGGAIFTVELLASRRRSTPKTDRND